MADDTYRHAPEPNANMGEPAATVDGRLKVTGEARYASDMPVGNPAYAFLVTSAIAKGRIGVSILTTRVAVPGVLDILTHETSAELKPGKCSAQASSAPRSTTLGPDIAHDGQIIAMVVADSYEAAREAAYRVKARYAAEMPSASFGSAGVTDEDASKVRSDSTSYPASRRRRSRLRRAPRSRSTPNTRRRRSTTIRSSCSPRPAPGRDDELTVYEPSQFVYGLKNGVAQAARHRPGEGPRRVSHFVGGAFGSKGAMTPRTALVALAARRLNRPVKLVATRDQGFTIATYRAETRHHIRHRRRSATASSLATAMKAGRSVRARSLHGRRRRRRRALYAFGTWPTQGRRSCMPTAIRRASCARRRSCPISTRSKAPWTSWR